MTYNVTSTKKLPFNYSGFIMKEGEKISTEIYRKHQSQLIDLYEKQSSIVNKMAIFNPYLAIKNISIVLSGTDFHSYHIFKEEAEAYRYNLAQTMNNLQIEHISNTTTSSADKKAVISQQYWKDFPPFQHRFLKKTEMVKAISLPIIVLFVWAILLLLSTLFFTKNLKAI
jgi:ABC-2 type transport system permease protein